MSYSDFEQEYRSVLQKLPEWGSLRSPKTD
jgi:hypothetical protein